MKRWLLLPLMCLVIVLSSGILTAEEPSSADDRWFWAWRESTGELVAYNAGGEPSVILNEVQSDDVFRVSSSAIRVDAGRMLAVLRVRDDIGLYLLDGDSATMIDPLNQTEPTNSQYSYDFLYSQLPYAVMVGREDDFYLINLDTGELTSFPNGSNIRGVSCFTAATGHWLERCMGISRNGRKLRYILDKSSQPEIPVWSLVERDLVTGEEHEFFAVDGSIPPYPEARYWETDCRPDGYGERWLCSIYAESTDNSLNDYFIVYPDGRQKVLVENNPRLSVEAYFGYDNEIVIDNPYSCEEVCYLEIYPADDGAFYRLAYAGSPLSAPAEHFRQFDTGYIMLKTPTGYSSLDEKGKEVDAGRNFCCESYEVISRDLRWLVSNMDNHRYLWDMAAGKRILQLDDDVYPFYDRIFSDYGLVMAGYWIYIFGDAVPLDIPKDYPGAFFNVLSDRTLLYHQDEATESLEAGIYQYNPETDEMTLLVADGQPIFQDVDDDRRP